MKRMTHTLAVAAILAVLPNPVSAATYYWDTNGATGGFGTAGGTWGTDAFWSTSSTGVLVPAVTNTTTADLLNFGTAVDGLGAGTINVTGATQGFATMTAGAASGAITLSGGTLNTAGHPTITVNNSSLTINSNLQGATGNFTKAGSGTLTFGGTNTYTAGNFFITGGGTVNFNGTHNTSSGFLQTSANSVTINVNGTENFGSANLSNSSPITTTINVNNGGTLSFSGAVLIGQNATGAVGEVHVFNGGTLNFAAADVRIANAGNNVITPQGTLTLDAGSAVNFNNAGTVLRIGNGGASTGTVNLDGGTMFIRGQIRGDAPVGGVAAGNAFFNFNGGTLRAGATSTTFLQGLDRANVRNGGAIIDTNGFNVTVNQALVHSNIGGDAAVDGGLTKMGAGTLTLSAASLAAASTYTGDTDIQGGILSINQAYLNDLADVLISSGAVFNLNFGSGIDTIGALFLGGVQQAVGTWGATGSGATNINDTYFTGTGRLLVTVAPSVVIPTPAALPAGLALLALAAGGGRRWRNR